MRISLLVLELSRVLQDNLCMVQDASALREPPASQLPVDRRQLVGILSHAYAMYYIYKADIIQS